jgi:tryptophanyl-tRNA synthetase
VATIAPVRERYLELARDPAYVQAVLRDGAGRARKLARERVQEAKKAIGLLAE